MRTIAILNLKGGVGKTTTAINLAAILATEHGQRVLLIDADSQHNATDTLLPPAEYNTVTNFLLGELEYVEDAIYPSAVRNLSVLPSDLRLATVGLPNVNGGRYSQRALMDIRDNLIESDEYDYVIIDCPSSFNHPGCQTAILAAESIIIPIKVDEYSVSGAGELVEQVELLRAINPALRVDGCLFTMYYRSDYTDDATRRFISSTGIPFYNRTIRRSNKADGATGADGGIMAFSPRSAIARDTRAWVDEFLGGEGK